MKPFKRILCPVDFSEPSRRALGLAAGLAADFGADLDLYHVVEPMALVPELPMAPVDYMRHSRRWAEEQMAPVRSSLELARAKAEIVEGEPHRRIVEKCAESGADLLVMGTQGLSGLQRLLLGSVTEKVLHQVDIPVLAVPPGGRPIAPIRPGGGARRFGRILLAVDFGSSTVATAEHALLLARRYQSDLLALHVWQIPREVYTGPAAWIREQDLERMAGEARDAQRARLEALLPASVRSEIGGVEIQMPGGSPPEQISSLAREWGADLVVVGAHGVGRTSLGWLGATCHRVIRSAPCPVLAVRARA